MQGPSLLILQAMLYCSDVMIFECHLSGMLRGNRPKKRADSFSSYCVSTLQYEILCMSILRHRQNQSTVSVDGWLGIKSPMSYGNYNGNHHDT